MNNARTWKSCEAEPWGLSKKFWLPAVFKHEIYKKELFKYESIDTTGSQLNEATLVLPVNIHQKARYDMLLMV